LVQNEDNFNYALQYGAKKESIKYFRLGNAIYQKHFADPDCRTIPSVDEIEFNSKKYKICTVSRLENLKIVDHSLKSFKAMRHSIDSHLYIFGDGSERNSLTKLAFELGIQDRIHFFGNVDQESLSQWLPQMDLVFSPSMGRALTEAALAGLPIVAYDTDCHPELVKTNETGILVKYLDIKAMSDAGDYMYENQVEAKVMGIAARVLALKLQDPEKLIRDQRLVFSELIQTAS
jgi:glycosyltransferase involved in cell wall biosynthesis